MAEGKRWIYDNGNLREPTTEELAEIESAEKPRGKLRPGDSVFVTIPAEHFEKFLAADRLSDELALAVGKAFLAWTSCCAYVFGLFVALSRADEQVADAVFNRLRNDKAQRDLVVDVAKEVWGK